METESLTVLEGLAHELRTPLGAIGGYAELLRLGMHGPLSTTQAEVLARIIRNQENMIGILTDFMAYAAVVAGAVRLTPTVTPMSSIVHEAIEQIVPRAVAQGVTIGLSALTHEAPQTPGPSVLDATDVTVLVDTRAAVTVVVELLRDALGTTGADGQINVDLSIADELAVVLVESNGEPIIASRLESVFVPFDRSRAAGHPPARPPALSLPHARQLARMLGGDVTAQSLDSRRSLRFQLPAAS